MNLSKVDIKDVLNVLGIQNISDFGDEINFSCFSDLHSRGDQNPSAYINKKTGLYYCFSCGERGNFIQLVSKVSGVSLMTASRWIYETYDSEDIEPGEILKELDSILNQSENLSKDKIDLEPYLERFKKIWVKSFRNIEPDTLNQYDIGWDNLSSRVVIPYRNLSGKIVGFKGRLIGKNNDRPKYKVLGDKNGDNKYGFPTFNAGEFVWGIDSVSDPNLVIVEGEFDAIYLRQLGIMGSVAIGTSKITDHKLFQLCNAGESAIVMLDPDEAGGQGASELFDKLSPYMPVKIAELENNDPSDSSKEEILNAIEKSQSKYTQIK